MAQIIPENGKIITLDSLSTLLENVNTNILLQDEILRNQISISQKMTHQMRILNMYKAHENEFIINDNIFENDELD